MSSRPVVELEPVFRVNRKTRDASRWNADSLESLGLWERQDLQQWFVSELRDPDRSDSELGMLEAVIGSPDVGETHQIGGPLLLISEEFSGWGHAGTRHGDRLDLLLLDTAGKLVVVELKRGVADEYADLQALRYAAYASTLNPTDVEQMLAQRLDSDEEAARALIADHVDGFEGTRQLDELNEVRMVLVAEGFTAPMTSTAMFLRERNLDVRCLQLTVRSVDDDVVAVAPRLLVPPPATEAFIVKRQQQEQVEAATKTAVRRRARSVDILLQHETIPVGTYLHFATANLGAKRRPLMERWLEEDPRRATATWNRLPGGKAMRWHADDRNYSASELALKILNEALDGTRTAVPGPDYWLAPGEETLVLSVLADRVLAASS